MNITYDEYQDQMEFSREMEAESCLIRDCWKEIHAERKADQPKFARLARKYLPRLRSIFYTGWDREGAQALIEELMLQSTVPFNDLDSPFEETEEGYQDVDSYVSQEDLIAAQKALDELARDDAEVAAEVQQNEAMKVQYKMDELLFELCQKIIDYYEPNGIKVYITDPDERGTVEQQSIEAQGPYDELADEEEVVDDLREITSVPIRQNNEQEMRMDPLAVTSLVKEWERYLKGMNKARYNAQAKLGRLGVKATDQAVAAEMKWVWDQAPSDQAIFDWMRDDLTLLLQEWAKRVGHKYSPQDMLIFLTGQTDELDFIVGKWNMQELYDLFGDEILDDALYGPYADPGLSPEETSPEDIEKFSEQVESELLSTYSENGEDWAAALKKAGVQVTSSMQRCGTKVFYQGVLGALHGDVAEIVEAGHDHWRQTISDIGNAAYHHVLKLTSDYKQAWRSFYNAGKVISLSAAGLKVQAKATGTVQNVDWGLAKWKLDRLEIALTPDERARLKRMLIDKGWGRQLVKAL